jgi:ATP-dependent DNA helicase RecQ
MITGMLDQPIEVLRNVFGFETFRGRQAEIIGHVLAGRDALVLMPTGGGKSLCYQIPSICRTGVGVVVSPLIALMRDQVEALRQVGVRAAALNSTLSHEEASHVERQMRDGALDLVYIAPERLLTDACLNLLESCEVALFAIDEAHCVSQWGHDFRPEYLRLAVLRERFPSVPGLALTATADGPTRRDIVERLGLSPDSAGGRVFVSGFDRPNIQYRVVPKRNPRDQLLEFLTPEHEGESGIVYCISRRKTEETAQWLSERGFQALPYHAGLDTALRTRNQDRFLKEEGIVMAATIAFGMGIDKPDVRFVAHLDLPKSVEAYYQETGRAGRDGLPSDAWMAYGLEDVVKQRRWIEDSDAAERQKQVERQKLSALLGYCETTRCRRQVLIEYFGEAHPAACGNCDTCLEPVDSFDGSREAQMALSCVYRTGQMFGAGHVIDVLLGGETERIHKFRHDRLSTYGIGKERSRAEWHSVFRQLAAMGLLVVDIQGHGGLRLGEDCREVLRGERRIDFRRDPVRKRRAKAERSGAGKSRERVELDGPEEEALFEALRARRMELANEQGIPAYVIFHDSTLIEMANKKPGSLEDLWGISGVGKAKLERYGEDFLAAIADFPAGGGESGRRRGMTRTAKRRENHGRASTHPRNA